MYLPVAAVSLYKRLMLKSFSDWVSPLFHVKFESELKEFFSQMIWCKTLTLDLCTDLSLVSAVVFCVQLWYNSIIFFRYIIAC